MARGNAVLNWFRKCAPCFTSEEYDRMSRSGGSSTPRTRTSRRNRRSEGSTKSRGENTGSSRGEGDVASSSRGGGDVASSSRGGGDVASSSRGGGDVASSSRGGVDVASSSRGGVDVASSSRAGGDVASSSRVGGDVASSSRGGGDVASSSRGAGDVASSSRGGGDVASSSNTVEEGPMFWTRDLDRHYLGSFSAAVMQANRNLEDYSQVEVGSSSTFVGVYDGHGGFHTAAHVRRNFTRHLTRHVTDNSTMSDDVLRYAFEGIEQSWLNIVNTRFARDPYVAARGTCCLVGVIWRGNLHVANVGDSRAILCREEEGSDKIVVQQLTRDDNVRDPKVRAEVMSEHGDEPDFIVEDENATGVFRIKGRIQVSKSIGDAYLKIPRFNLDRVDHKFVLNSPILEGKPALSAVPIASARPIEPQDRFVIFASDGLWDLMSNQEVADFVHENPNEGIAERLVMHALTGLAVKLGGSSYEDIKQYTRESGQRRKIHDDISVVVIFFDHTLQLDADIQEEFPKYSIREGSVSSEGESNFTALDELPE